MGKGLGGGAIALSAVGVQDRHFSAIRHGTGSFNHGGTFTHHGPAASAGLALLRIVEREKLVDRVARYGKAYFKTGLWYIARPAWPVRTGMHC